jgi:hypothetical protein
VSRKEARLLAALEPSTAAWIDSGAALGLGTFRDASKPFGVLTEKGTPDNKLVIREQTGNRSLVVFDSGDEVTVQAGEDGIRFLLISGQPLEEPVAWYGPIVMNTQGGAGAGRIGIAQRDVHQAQVNVPAGRPPGQGQQQSRSRTAPARADLPCATGLRASSNARLSYCFANRTFAERSEIQRPLRTSPSLSGALKKLAETISQ